MPTITYRVSLAAPGQPGAAPAAAAVYLRRSDPADHSFDDAWLFLHGGARSAEWTVEEGGTEAVTTADARVWDANGRMVSVPPFRVESPELVIGAAPLPRTIAVLPFRLAFDALETACVELTSKGSRAACQFDAANTAPAFCTLPAETADQEIVWQVTYRYADGTSVTGEPMREQGGVVLVPPAPTGRTVAILPDAAARAIGVRSITARVVDSWGRSLRHTWTSDLETAWTPLVLHGKDGAPGDMPYTLSYTVTAVSQGEEKTFASPDFAMAGPDPVRLAQLGFARFAADLWDTVDSIEVSVTVPQPAKTTLTRGAASAVLLVGADPAGPSPGALTYDLTYSFSPGNTYISRGNRRQDLVVDLASPLRTKVVDVIADGMTPLVIDVRLSCTGIETGNGWALQWPLDPVRLTEGRSYTRVAFPAVEPDRAALSFQGTATTLSGLIHYPRSATTAGTLVIGVMDGPRWASVMIQPSVVDWASYRAVDVTMSKTFGDLTVEETFHIDASSGDTYWGYYDAPDQSLSYDWQADYVGIDGVRHRCARTSGDYATLTLPRRPEDA